jgi:hypothetical protein
MSSPRIQEAAALVQTITDALSAAGLAPRAIATTDPAQVPSGARYGVVLVAPPALAFPTWEGVEATWSLHIIAGTPTDQLAAWATIDGIIQALVDARTLSLEDAEPGQFAQLNGPALPAYTITLNPQ